MVYSCNAVTIGSWDAGMFANPLTMTIIIIKRLADPNFKSRNFKARLFTLATAHNVSMKESRGKLAGHSPRGNSEKNKD